MLYFYITVRRSTYRLTANRRVHETGIRLTMASIPVAHNYSVSFHTRMKSGGEYSRSLLLSGTFYVTNMTGDRARNQFVLTREKYDERRERKGTKTKIRKGFQTHSLFLGEIVDDVKEYAYLLGAFPYDHIRHGLTACFTD